MEEKIIGAQEKNFNKVSFVRKILNFGKKAGSELINKVLVLFYVAIDEDTPVWAKTVIYGALGYFILPLDAIPDLIPLTGFSDDLGAIVSAMSVIGAHLKAEHVEKANATTERLFGL